MARINLKSGDRYGFLTVIGVDENKTAQDGVKHVYWKFKCDCGKITSKRASHVASGKIVSCGHFRSHGLDSHRAEIAEKKRTHGLSKTRLYRIWAGMKQRCGNASNDEYKNYGARGIKVCEEWTEFENFMKWAYANGYDERLTIDRIDVNGNYEPDNCRWADSGIQANNKRTSVFVNVNGKKMTCAQCSKMYHMPYTTVLRRAKNGVDILC